MSESFLIAGILSISGGLQDAYTYMYRGKVFANAQTGNIVLLAQNLVDRNWQAVLRYFSPLLFFALGVAMAECIRMKYQKAQKIHWRQLVLAIEILLLFAVGFIPNEIDLLANAMVSFACAMQVQAFRKVNGYAFASTMCIGNLRSGMESLCAYGKTKDKKILRKSGYYFGIIFLFAVGAALGGHMIGYIGAKTIWISCTILLISFLCMFIKEEKEEHPEIMEEEQEIRDNLKNIRKEARDVEHILEDDIRSQIEKNNVKTGEKRQKSYRKPGHSVKIQSRLQGGYLRIYEPGSRGAFIRMVAGRGLRRTGMECTDRFGSGVHWYLYCQCQNKHRK